LLYIKKYIKVIIQIIYLLKIIKMSKIEFYPQNVEANYEWLKEITLKNKRYQFQNFTVRSKDESGIFWTSEWKKYWWTLLTIENWTLYEVSAKWKKYDTREFKLKWELITYTWERKSILDSNAIQAPDIPEIIEGEVIEASDRYYLIDNEIILKFSKYIEWKEHSFRSVLDSYYTWTLKTKKDIINIILKLNIDQRTQIFKYDFKNKEEEDSFLGDILKIEMEKLSEKTN